MKKLYRILSLCIIFIFTFTLSSCKLIDLNKPSWRKLNHTTYAEMLTRNHSYYYLIFYSPDCIFCEEILPVALEYSAKENTYPLYVVNIDDLKNNNGLMAEEGYQYFSYIGTENYADVVLENVPALIIVDHNKVETLISSQNTNTPKSEIIALLQK